MTDRHGRLQLGELNGTWSLMQRIFLLTFWPICVAFAWQMRNLELRVVSIESNMVSKSHLRDIWTAINSKADQDDLDDHRALPGHTSVIERMRTIEREVFEHN